jgi:hypothetical protein
MTKKFIPLFIILIFFFCFCNKNKDIEPEPENPFDKQGLLQNMADNVILPNYIAFSTSLDSLILCYNTFKTTTSSSDFQIVKQKLHVAYLKYQRISLYEFGPAEQEIVRMNFNVFPTDSVQIKTNISSGSYTLQMASNFDAKGFPALDYLLYDLNKTEAEIMQEFSISPNKKQYVSDVLNEMQTKTNSIITVWNLSYKNQFVNSLSTDVGSSIGFLINQLNFELDNLKNGKIGIPLGKKTLDIALPEKCEAYYGAQSLEYALATLTTIENTYLGRSISGADGKGFDDYLDHLNASYGNVTLNSAIKNQFNIVRAKLNAINGVLSTQVINNPALVNSAYSELVKLLVLLKTDMPSNLGVVITYQDGDGD